MTIRKTATMIALLLAGTTAGQSQGINGTAEFRAQQAALEKTYPQLNVVTDEYMHLQIPGYTMGETMGVATNSKGHLFVYSRTQSARHRARRHGGDAVGIRPERQISSRNGARTTMPLPSPMPCAWTRTTMSGRWMKARA